MQFILVMTMYVSHSDRIDVLNVQIHCAFTYPLWHCHCSQELDYLAAKNAGMRSLLLVREGIIREDIPEDTVVIDSLNDVSKIL